MSTATTVAFVPQSVILRNTSWETYVRLRDERENDHIRMTYDQGTLELMSPLSLHEWFHRLTAKHIDVLTMELGIPIRSGGSTTFRSEDLKRGLEPDECFYIFHEPSVRGKDDLDLSIDPPPDLAIEVDVTRSSKAKMAIYAALGVPELWRYDGEEILVFLLDAQGNYQRSETSLNLPMLPIADLKRFLDMRGSFDETTLLIMFRDWVRATLAM